MSLEFGKWSTARDRITVADPVVSGSVPSRRGLLNTRGLFSILVMARFTGGTTPTVDVEVYAYDEERDAPSAAGFGKLTTISGVADGIVQKVETYGQRIFLRAAAITGAPTALELRVAPALTDFAH